MFVDKVKLFAQVRILLNDSQGRIFSDRDIETFLGIAVDRLPLLTASLIASSRGITDLAKFLCTWPGTVEDVAKELTATDLAKRNAEALGFNR